MVMPIEVLREASGIAMIFSGNCIRGVKERTVRMAEEPDKIVLTATKSNANPQDHPQNKNGQDQT